MSDAKPAITSLDEFNSDIGLRKFVNQTYLHAGGTIMTSLLSTAAVITSYPQMINFSSIGSGFIIALGGVLCLGPTNYTVRTRIYRDKHSNKEVECLYSENSFARRSIGNIGLWYDRFDITTDIWPE